MEIGIVAQRGNSAASALAEDIAAALRTREVDVLVDETTGTEIGVSGVPVDRMADCPLVVSVGGDGTFLFTARRVGSTPILGVNLGEVGFLNAVPPGDATEQVLAEVDRIRATGEPRYREADRLAVAADGLSVPPALNEIVVHGPQRGRGNGVSVSVTVDDSHYADTHADGVLVASPTGSTAYNLSEGGPLVHPAVTGMIVNGMAPEKPMRPVVIPPDATVRVTVDDADTAVVISDGSERQRIEPPATVTVERDGEPTRIAGPRPDFFRALTKLA